VLDTGAENVADFFLYSFAKHAPGNAKHLAVMAKSSMGKITRK